VYRIKITEGGVSTVCEVMEKYTKKAIVNLVISLVAEQKLTVAEAAEKAGVSEEEIKEAMKKQ
jgi:hypothetical protein